MSKLQIILKDIWIDSNCMRKGNIIATLEAEAGELDKPLVKEYFLMTICCGDVQLAPQLVDDTMTGLMLNNSATTASFCFILGG